MRINPFTWIVNNWLAQIAGTTPQIKPTEGQIDVIPPVVVEDTPEPEIMEIKPLDEGQLTANFHIREFACKDGTEVPEMYRDNVKALAVELQKIRDYLGKPIHINSAYRTVAHNRRIGGAPGSKHLTAEAADITVRGVSPAEVFRRIEEMMYDGRLRNGGRGKYNSFTHIDISTPRRWQG